MGASQSSSVQKTSRKQRGGSRSQRNQRSSRRQQRSSRRQQRSSRRQQRGGEPAAYPFGEEQQIATPDSDWAQGLGENAAVTDQMEADAAGPGQEGGRRRRSRNQQKKQQRRKQRKSRQNRK